MGTEKRQHGTSLRAFNGKSQCRPLYYNNGKSMRSPVELYHLRMQTNAIARRGISASVYMLVLVSPPEPPATFCSAALISLS